VGFAKPSTGRFGVERISPGRVAWRKSQIVEWMARCGEIFDARRQRMNSKRDEAHRRRVKKPEAAGRDKLNPVGPASR
jgi:hypothetical protein